MSRGKAILLVGGTVIDPATERNGAFDVLVRGGRIAAVDLPGSIDAEAERVDVAGCWVTPGLIDMHVHLREPGYEYKETVLTGTLAAVAGGFTAVACMANTKPVNDSAAVTEYILERANAAGLARVHPIGALSVNLAGCELAEIGEMREAGIVAVSDDGMPVADGNLMRRALEYTRLFDLPVIVHEEDPQLAGDGVMHEGGPCLHLGLKGMPSAAEEAMVARDLALLEQTGGRLHIAHISTAGSIRLLRAAKQRGLPVTAEVTPHHFALTDEAVRDYDTNAKMKPPLRPQCDVDVVIEALRDGTIDAIATDHAPHHRDEKEVEFDAAAFGIVGLETALPLALRLVRESRVDPATLVRAMSVNPARILGLEAGSLAVGMPADITVIDPNRAWTVELDRLHSKSKNSPFGGWPMVGSARLTMVGGRILWPRGDEG
jgi:dihydroorotase